MAQDVAAPVRPGLAPGVSDRWILLLDVSEPFDLKTMPTQGFSIEDEKQQDDRFLFDVHEVARRRLMDFDYYHSEAIELAGAIPSPGYRDMVALPSRPFGEVPVPVKVGRPQTPRTVVSDPVSFKDASVPQIVKSLIERKQAKSVCRLAELLFHRQHEPDEDPVDLDSLRTAAGVLADTAHLTEPTITLTGAGQVSFEWPLVERGRILLIFRQDGKVTYVFVKPGRQERNRGVGTSDEVVDEIEDYRKWIV